jgi:hypothetical protein
MEKAAPTKPAPSPGFAPSTTQEKPEPETPAPAPPENPKSETTPETPESPAPPKTDPKARAILDRLEASGKTYTALRADVDYTVVSRLTGDEEIRTGWIAFQNAVGKTPAKFRISFETLQLGGEKKTKTKLDYIFDGRWGIRANHKTRTITRFQVVAEGETTEPLRIGKGPFPVPFGQKADEVVRLLEAATREPAEDDPPDCDYLKLIPHKEHEGDFNFTRMELWVNQKTNLPAQIRFCDSSKNITTVRFGNTKTEAEIQAEWFTMEKPAGWSETWERLE